MATVKDIIDRSMRLIAVKDAGQDLTTTEYADLLYILNEMLYGWSVEGFMPVSTTEITHAITSGVGSYTVGVGADIDTTRPTEINRGFVRDSANYDTQLDIVGKGDYDKNTDKTLTGRPIDLFYDSDYAIGTFYLYPVPSEGYTMVLTVPTVFTSYSANTDTIALPDEFLGPLAYNLAINASAEFTRPVPEAVAVRARELKNNLKRLHSYSPSKMDINPIGRNRGGRSWNINSGDYY